MLSDVPESEIMRYRRAASRFRAAVDQISFDASGTAWFGAGAGTLSDAQLARAVHLLCESYQLQLKPNLMEQPKLANV
jgi:hypothetical protein